MATETPPKTISVGPRIEKTPGVCGGRAVIEKTRIAVWLLVTLQQHHHYTDDYFLDAFPRLTQEDLDAARDYYATNTAEIDQDIADQGDH